jgi:MoaA/NifB/PqqE/SkfB family radical SAM enzyme
LVSDVSGSYPLAMVNITNRCTLKCKHCFVFREGNPNKPSKNYEIPTPLMLKEIKRYKRKYGINSMVWMGGEPLLRKDVLQSGVKMFSRNTVTTNGTLPLINLEPKTRWVISLDGPQEINDEIRGKGSLGVSTKLSLTYRIYQTILQVISNVSA